MHRPLAAVLLLLFPLHLMGAAFERFTPGVRSTTPPKVKVTTALNQVNLQKGQQAVLAVILDVPKGYHAQSNEPFDPNFIPTEVVPGKNGVVTFFPSQYPEAEIQDAPPPVGRISVFGGRVVVYVPFQVGDDAPDGPITIAGTTTYQICDDRGVCLAPETTAFSATASVNQPIRSSPDEAALFAKFDWVKGFSAQAAPPWPVRGGGSANKPVATSVFGAINSLYLALASAFVVGIIFNVMPCVLPVVPLKALSFYQVAQHNRAKSVALGAVFSLGIVATFAALAVLVLVMNLFSWGQLFGKPWFVISLTVILVAMAMSTFGVFTVLLPTGVYSFAPRHDTYGGNFLFGILTAVLSTPCTFGMFVGVLTWAASRPAGVGVATVMMVGVGMAFPYIVLSFLPELARKMPRTGAWAELVKQAMAFPLLATALFFLGGVYFPKYQWHAVFAVIALGTVFLLVRTAMVSRNRAISLPIVALLCGAALWFTRPVAAPPASESIPWTTYTPEALETARKDKVVVVEFTASWCSNCIYLENTTLHAPATVDAVKRHNAVPLRVDLSRSDAIGWPLLKQLNSAGGIPLTAVYHPGQTDPILLSGIYKPEDLIAALKAQN